MFECIDATTDDISVIQKIAEETWWATYSPIIPDHQIRYMLEKIYSTDELTTSMKSGKQKFILLRSTNAIEGFAAFGRRPENPQVYKLHKLYVLPHNHGKGLGKKLIDEVMGRVVAEGGQTLDLNVNRYNPAKTFYEKIGFRVVREEDVPVGPYWMNDYVMTLPLKGQVFREEGK
jgi:diamine N-acetyltransferase